MQREVTILDRFLRHDSEVLLVYAASAGITAEKWTGKRTVSYVKNGAVTSYEGELISESTRSTEGEWTRLYYVRFLPPHHFEPAVRTIEIDFGDE